MTSFHIFDVIKPQLFLNILGNIFIKSRLYFKALFDNIVAAAAAAAKLLQSCLTLCDHRDGSPPGSTVPGILQ